MPTIVASSILGKASILLQDVENVRWPLTELLGWLNDAVREVANARPDQSSKFANVTLVAGTRQTLPSDATELMRVVRNTGEDGTLPGIAVRETSIALLDDLMPDWHSTKPAKTIKHYAYDHRSPRSFYVFPPSDGTTQVEVLYAGTPTLLTDPTQVIPLDDMFANLTLDYVLFRAYSKDYEASADADRAAMHRKVFSDSLSAKSQADQGVGPVEEGHG